MALIETLAGPRRTPAKQARPSLLTRLAVWRSRRALANLDARQLADIGITASEADKEARLALWDVPNTWPNN